MKDDFTVLQASGLDDKPITARDLESAYRRGYSQGYFKATQDLKTLFVGGFARVRECLNVLEAHAESIYDWRVAFRQPRGAQHLPPELPEINWWRLRDQVFARDGKKCVSCGAIDNIQVDHVLPVSAGGLPLLENLRPLCKKCNLSRNRGRL